MFKFIQYPCTCLMITYRWMGNSVSFHIYINLVLENYIRKWTSRQLLYRFIHGCKSMLFIPHLDCEIKTLRSPINSNDLSYTKLIYWVVNTELLGLASFCRHHLNSISDSISAVLRVILFESIQELDTLISIIIIGG